MSNNTLHRSTPETQGISSESILAFIADIERQGLELHSFMLLRHCHVVAEGWWAPYKSEYPQEIYSLTKSFTSTAIGFAVQEGLLSIHDPVLSFFPELESAKIKKNMKELTIRHLLSMSTGHAEDTLRLEMNTSFLQESPNGYIGNQKNKDWALGFLELPILEPPGRHFLYNSGASHMLSVILSKVTGQTTLDYLTPRLFLPLGIRKPTWSGDPLGRSTGAWGLRLKTEDIARFGQFLLQKGTWNGRRILSEAWIDAATSPQICTLFPGTAEESPAPFPGYGYQFWICKDNAYRGDGAMGQFCIVIPKKDAVIAITSGEKNTKNILDAVWKFLLPAMKENALTPNQNALSLLQNKLSVLELIKSGGPVAPFPAGCRKYKITSTPSPVEEITFFFHEKNCLLAWRDSAGNHTLRYEIGKWTEQKLPADETTAVTGIWCNENTLHIHLCRINTPYHDQILCTFEHDLLRFSYMHPDFIPVEYHLTGKILIS